MSQQSDRHTLSRIVTNRIQSLSVDSPSVADWERLIATASSEGVSPSVY